jgi:hypothetical protein
MVRPAAEIVAEVHMRRALHKGSILIVEGAIDSRVYRQFTHNTCRIVIAEGKQNALDVIHRLRPAFPGLLAIVDPDRGRRDPVPNDICLTDGNDIETMLFASPAFDRVVAATSDRDRVDGVEALTGSPLRHLIERAAADIGALRSISASAHLDLTFKGIDFPRFLDARTLSVDGEALIEELRRKSVRPTLPVNELLDEIRVVTGPAAPADLLCGHDLTSILSFALRKTIGSHDAREVSTDRLALSLGYAFDRNDWERSHLAKCLAAWEADNDGYVVQT